MRRSPLRTIAPDKLASRKLLEIPQKMKRFALFLFLSAITAAAGAQTATKTSATGSSKAKTAATATAARSTGASEPWIKLPPGVPRVAHGPVRIPFTLRYEDIKIGTGPEGEPGKVWHIKYTGWRASDGAEFDSWEDHRQLSVGVDGKPEFGPDGRPKMADPQPLEIPQGVGHVIPGFDWGIAGMRIGGKRRLFVPWQLAYGTHSLPDRPGHAGIPAKSDLIFDVELVEVTEMPQPHPAAMPVPHPGVTPGTAPVHIEPGGPPHPGASAEPNAAPAQPSTPAQPEAQPK